MIKMKKIIGNTCDSASNIIAVYFYITTSFKREYQEIVIIIVLTMVHQALLKMPGK